VEEIRKKVASLERREWRIKFHLAKAHAGTCGNEIADRLAKEEARGRGTEHEFTRIPKSTLYRGPRNSYEKMAEWMSQKAAATRQYFPTIQDRLKSKIKLTPKMTAVLTGHGMTKANLHRFHLRTRSVNAVMNASPWITYFFNAKK
jgi:hypothetical protein